MRAVGDRLQADLGVKAIIVVGVTLLDVVWVRAANFTFVTESLGSVAIVLTSLLIAGWIYGRIPGKSHLVAMTTETAWLVAFCASAGLLSNLVITLNMPLIDDRLVAIDRMVGFDWVRWYDFVCSRPALGVAFSIAYIAALPETVVVIVVLAMVGRVERIRR